MEGEEELEESQPREEEGLEGEKKKKQSSLRLTSIESVMPSSHLILCHQGGTAVETLLEAVPREGDEQVSW